MRYGIPILCALLLGAPPLSAQAALPAGSAWHQAVPHPVRGGDAARPGGLLAPREAPAPAPPLSARTGSLGRSMGWGALLGASAGVLSSLVVLSLCDDYCDGSRAEGIVLHVGVGAAGGAAIGALVRQLRR